MLDDVLQEDLTVVFCGTARGRKSAELGFYYAGPGNKFYRALHLAGFTRTRLLPKDCYSITEYGIGLTDLITSQAGNDDKIVFNLDEIDEFIAKMVKYRPNIIAFTSKTAAAWALHRHGKTKGISYGFQEQMIGASKVFVLPSPSGSAGTYWAQEVWDELYAAVKTLRK